MCTYFADSADSLPAPLIPVPSSMPPQPIPTLRELRIESQAIRDVVSATRTSPAAFKINIDLTQTKGSSLQKEVISLNTSAEQNLEFTRGPDDSAR